MGVLNSFRGGDYEWIFLFVRWMVFIEEWRLFACYMIIGRSISKEI